MPCQTACEASCEFAPEGPLSCNSVCEVACQASCESQVETDEAREELAAARTPKYVPEGLLAKVLLVTETMLVVEFGSRESGINHYDFVVRPEHGSTDTNFDGATLTLAEIRKVNRAFVPIHFSVRFRDQSAVIPWNEVYPWVIEDLAGASLANFMAAGVVKLARERLDPNYTPF